MAVAVEEGLYTPIIRNAENLGLQEISSLMKDYIIRAKSKSIFIEISGGITLENLSDYIIDGVDAISSGALMHQAQNQKLKLEFMEAQI